LRDLTEGMDVQTQVRLGEERCREVILQRNRRNGGKGRGRDRPPSELKREKLKKVSGNDGSGNKKTSLKTGIQQKNLREDEHITFSKEINAYFQTKGH